MNLDAVAERVNHGSKVIASRRVNKGKANLGVFIHTAECGDGGRVRFVEKRTKRESEIRICEELVARADLTSSFPFPQIYAVEKRDGYHAVFMQYCPMVGRSPDVTSVAAHSVATSLWSLHKFESDWFNGIDIERWRLKGRSRIATFVERGLENNEFSGIQPETHFDMLDLYFSQDVVLSHNDLFLSNLSMGKERVGPAIFIDFGVVGPNIVGSDLFGFFRKSLKSEKMRCLHSLAVDAYAEIGGIDRDLVDFLSRYAAFAKSLERLSRFSRKGVAASVQKERMASEKLSVAAMSAFLRLQGS